MSGQMLAVLLPIIALVLVGFFATLWMKDRNRSQEESHDSTRLDTDNSTKTTKPTGHDGPVHREGSGGA